MWLKRMDMVAVRTAARDDRKLQDGHRHLESPTPEGRRSTATAVNAIRGWRTRATCLPGNEGLDQHPSPDQWNQASTRFSNEARGWRTSSQGTKAGLTWPLSRLPVDVTADKMPQTAIGPAPARVYRCTKQGKEPAGGPGVPAHANHVLKAAAPPSPRTRTRVGGQERHHPGHRGQACCREPSPPATTSTREPPARSHLVILNWCIPRWRRTEDAMGQRWPTQDQDAELITRAQTAARHVRRRLLGCRSSRARPHPLTRTARWAPGTVRRPPNRPPQSTPPFTTREHSHEPCGCAKEARERLLFIASFLAGR